MKVHVEAVPEIDNERIVTYRYPIRRFRPESVRRSLKRAMHRADQGPDCAVVLEIFLKEGAAEIPKLGKHFNSWTCGGVLKGCLEIGDPEATRERAEAGEDCTILLPLASIAFMRAEYRRWEPA